MVKDLWVIVLKHMHILACIVRTFRAHFVLRSIIGQDFVGL